MAKPYAYVATSVIRDVKIPLALMAIRSAEGWIGILEDRYGDRVYETGGAYNTPMAACDNALADYRILSILSGYRVEERTKEEMENDTRLC